MQVENYFAEQPSGRNLLHVLPQGVPPGSTGSAAPTAAPARSHALGTYTEAPSGRALVSHAVSEHSSVAPPAAGRRGRSIDVSEPSEDDSSSRWNDSDAQSGHRYAAPGGGGGGGRGEGGGVGASTFNTEAASGYPSSEVASSAAFPEAAEETSEDDLEISAGSAAASRVGGELYGSEFTAGHGSEYHDTAAGGSSVDARSYGGRLQASGAPASRVPGQPQNIPGLHDSGNSSTLSRVQAPSSELSSQQMTAAQSSWRSTPGDGGEGLNSGAGYVPRSASGETTDSSVLMEQHRQHQMERGQSREDGDFGTVWLANRAHARRYDSSQGRS